jgi:hypothetical protein
MIYGEQEDLALGDSVEVRGCLRLSNGNYFFPETGLATLGDVAIENVGVSLVSTGATVQPLVVSAADFCDDPPAYGGSLIEIRQLQPANSAPDGHGNIFVKLASGSDTAIAYFDADTHAAAVQTPTECYDITGIVVRMKMPDGFAPSPSWCLAPRSPGDVLTGDCSTSVVRTTWGSIKAGAARQD